MRRYCPFLNAIERLWARHAGEKPKRVIHLADDDLEVVEDEVLPRRNAFTDDDQPQRLVRHEK